MSDPEWRQVWALAESMFYYIRKKQERKIQEQERKTQEQERRIQWLREYKMYQETILYSRINIFIVASSILVAAFFGADETCLRFPMALLGLVVTALWLFVVRRQKQVVDDLRAELQVTDPLYQRLRSAREDKDSQEKRSQGQGPLFFRAAAYLRGFLGRHRRLASGEISRHRRLAFGVFPGLHRRIDSCELPGLLAIAITICPKENIRRNANFRFAVEMISLRRASGQRYRTAVPARPREAKTDRPVRSSLRERSPRDEA